MNTNNAYSGELNLLCGVPQGSILGPLLFSLYINDLPKASRFMTRLVADDTALILPDSNISSLNERVNSEFAKIEQWLISNKLSLNLSKTKFLLISPSHKPIKPDKFHISIRGCNIERCQSIKYLGGQIDELLSRKTHIEFIIGKLFRSLGIFGKLGYYLNQIELIKIYYAFFYPHISYGILGWGSVNQTTLKTIQILQNKTLRIINKISWNDYVANNTLFVQHHLLKIRDIYNLELAKFMYMSSQKTLPEVFQNYFLSFENVHKHYTSSKSNKNYFLPYVRCNNAKLWLKFKGAQLWASIPSNLKKYSFHTFVKKYKEYLRMQYIQLTRKLILLVIHHASVVGGSQLIRNLTILHTNSHLFFNFFNFYFFYFFSQCYCTMT